MTKLCVSRLGLFACVLSVGLCLATSPVWAQTNEKMQLLGRINQLENQIQTLSRYIYRGEKPSGSSASTSGTARLTSGNAAPQVAANLEVRMSQMESQIRELTGLIERQGYEVSQIKSHLDRALSDIDYRLSSSKGVAPASERHATHQPRTGKAGFDTKLSMQDFSNMPGQANAGNHIVNPPQGGVVISDQKDFNNPTVKTLGTLKHSELTREPLSSTLAEPAAGLSTTSPVISTTSAVAKPEMMYETAFMLVREADYTKAEQELKTFLTTYPSHSLAANAQYWLAETYYVRGDFHEAAKQFAKGYQEYPQGAKAGDNLLKLGLALAKLDKTSDACLTFQQLDKDFPGDNSPVKRRASQEKKRLACE